MPLDGMVRMLARPVPEAYALKEDYQVSS